MMQIDFLPTIVTEAGLKSAGVGRIDLSEPLNRNEIRITEIYLGIEKILSLAQCPDPNASIELTLHYQSLGEVGQTN
jgi:hypothetical protein